MTALDRTKVIIFDFDGVMLDSARLKTAAFAEVYQGEAEAKIAAVIAYQEEHGGIGRREKFAYFERVVFGRPAGEGALDRLCAHFASIIDAAMLDCPFIPGAEAALAAFDGVVPMHVVSGMPEVDLKAVIARRGLARYFRTVAGSPTSKRAAFEAIMAMEGVAARDCLAVGDSLTEYHAALDLGIPFLAIVAPNEPDRFPQDVAKLPDLVRFAEGAQRAR